MINISAGIGAMLLGGWVLTSPAYQDNVPPAQPLPQEIPPAAAAPAPALPGQGAGQYGTRSMDEQSYRRMLEEERKGRYQRSGGPTARTQEPSGGAMPPTSPTGAGGLGLPLPPTADQTAAQGTGMAPAGAGASQMPFAPTAPPTPAGGRSSYRGTQRPSYSAASSPSIGGAGASGQKAFSTYNPFSSGVSPYMNLFRRDTAGGTVDNYTTLVRPALEQRAANQRFNMDIYGLERRARIQQHSLQQIQQTERSLQGIGTPQYYMNYGGYYGGQGY